MGYHTSFDGEFAVTPVLAPEHKAYLKQFSETRRMRRDAAIAETLPDPIRIAAGLPIGYEGSYFVGGEDYRGQGQDTSVLDSNTPPGSIPYNPQAGTNAWPEYMVANKLAQDLGLAQPGLWCQWIPDETGNAIVWDEGEKFYEYVSWIDYLLEHFLRPWGYTLDGDVEWDGEESDDRGIIRIQKNVISIAEAKITFKFTPLHP